MVGKQIGILADDELKRLCVPLDHCLSVETGPVDLSVLVKLEALQFDQAPVYLMENADYVLGLVETQRLRVLYDKGDQLLPDDPTICDEENFLRIGCFVRVEEILKKMMDRRAVLVIRESSASEHGYSAWSYGLLTISDLNRQPLRAVLYSLLAELESGMALLVEGLTSDPWDWLKTLDEEHQVRVLGYWELTKRRGVAVGPVAALTLTQLIQVVSRNKDLLLRLGYDSRSAFDRETGKIPELRNSVMHPVRPLVLDQGYVASFRPETPFF